MVTTIMEQTTSKIVFKSEISGESMTRLKNLFLANFAVQNKDFDSHRKKKADGFDTFLKRLDAAYNDFHNRQQKSLDDAANEERKRITSFRCDFNNTLNRAGL